MPENRAEAVLFDLDGTFADTAPDLGAALNRLRADLDLSPLPLTTLRPFVSQGVRGMLRAGLDMLPDHPDYRPFYDRFLVHYQSAICVDTCLFDGIDTLVDCLESHGIAWGIVTNKSQRFTAPLMESLGYARRALGDLPGAVQAQFVCGFDGAAPNSLALFGSAGTIVVPQRPADRFQRRR